MIQINLLPDLKKEFIKAQKTKALVISTSILVTLGALGLSALLFIYVVLLQQLQISFATDDIKTKESQLKAIPDVNKYLTVQAQLASLPDLHNAKGSYSRLFDYLSVLNPSAPNNISLSDLQLATQDHSITITGLTGSFQTLNVFVDTLKNTQISYTVEGQKDAVTQKMFDQVLVQSSGLAKVESQNLVSFAIRTIYNPAAFDALNTNVTAVVPNITTTQSVTQSPTVQIFNDKKGGQ